LFKVGGGGGKADSKAMMTVKEELNDIWGGVLYMGRMPRRGPCGMTKIREEVNEGRRTSALCKGRRFRAFPED